MLDGFICNFEMVMLLIEELGIEKKLGFEIDSVLEQSVVFELN